MLKVFALLLICLGASPLLANTAQKQPSSPAQQTIEVLVIKGVIADLPAFLQNDSLLTVNDFDRPGVRRDLVDYVLLRQALNIGLKLNQHDNVIVKDSLWHGSSYNRLLSNLQFGKYTLYSNTVWREDFREDPRSNSLFKNALDHLFISSPTLRYGEFEAGLYMNPDNPKMAPFDLSTMRAVSSKQWRPDWQALSELPLKQLYNEINWENMLKMVQSQRADFMLIPFSREPNLSYNALGITLMPVHGVKVAIAGSRGWAISRDHPSGDIAYQAIEKGLQELRKQAVIPRAYIEAGVINTHVANWKVINVDTNSQASTGAQVLRPKTTR